MVSGFGGAGLTQMGVRGATGPEVRGRVARRGVRAARKRFLVGARGDLDVDRGEHREHVGLKERHQRL